MKRREFIGLTTAVDTSVDEGGGDQKLRLGRAFTWSVGDPGCVKTRALVRFS